MWAVTETTVWIWIKRKELKISKHQGISGDELRCSSAVPEEQPQSLSCCLVESNVVMKYCISFFSEVNRIPGGVRLEDILTGFNLRPWGEEEWDELPFSNVIFQTIVCSANTKNKHQIRLKLTCRDFQNSCFIFFSLYSELLTVTGTHHNSQKENQPLWPPPSTRIRGAAKKYAN